MPTEKEKMLAGELYDAADTELSAMRRKAHLLTHQLNHSRDDEQELRQQLLQELLGSYKELPSIEPPFYCDYGSQIHLGEKVFFNFNCVVLDVMPVHIGDNVLFGPNVQIYTATHPLDVETRLTWLEFAKPITIGSNVWVGGGAMILPGVTIGSGSVIGAGSVVNKNIPANVFAAGNPCKVIRELT